MNQIIENLKSPKYILDCWSVLDVDIESKTYNTLGNMYLNNV